MSGLATFALFVTILIGAFGFRISKDKDGKIPWAAWAGWSAFCMVLIIAPEKWWLMFPVAVAMWAGELPGWKRPFGWDWWGAWGVKPWHAIPRGLMLLTPHIGFIYLAAYRLQPTGPWPLRYWTAWAEFFTGLSVIATYGIVIYLLRIAL